MTVDVLSLLENRRVEIMRRFKVRRIGVFGSSIHPETKEPNDIDILVDFEESSFDNLMDLMEYLENLYQRKVDVITTASLSPYLRSTVTREVVWCEG